jgi:hypothetical protein
MRVYIEFVAEDGTRYFYPNGHTVTRGFGGWYLPYAMVKDSLWAREIFDDNDDQIQYLEQLARTRGWRMELVPTDLQIGTYLSTYKHEGIFYEKVIPIYLILLPFIIIAIISYMGWLNLT